MVKFHVLFAVLACFNCVMFAVLRVYQQMPCRQPDEPGRQPRCMAREWCFFWYSFLLTGFHSVVRQALPRSTGHWLAATITTYHQR